MAERQENIENSMRIKSDYELFLESYEKPTQIYRFLKSRHTLEPVFLQRNLSYMKDKQRNRRHRGKRRSLRLKEIAQQTKDDNKDISTEIKSDNHMKITFHSMDDTSNNSNPILIEILLYKFKHPSPELLITAPKCLPCDYTSLGKCILPMTDELCSETSSIMIPASLLSCGAPTGTHMLAFRAIPLMKQQGEDRDTQNGATTERRQLRKRRKNGAVDHNSNSQCNGYGHTNDSNGAGNLTPNSKGINKKKPPNDHDPLTATEDNVSFINGDHSTTEGVDTFISHRKRNHTDTTAHTSLPSLPPSKRHCSSHSTVESSMDYYYAELVAFDSRQECLLLDGEYELNMTKFSHSTKKESKCTTNGYKSCSLLTWEKDQTDHTLVNPVTLKLSVNWSFGSPPPPRLEELTTTALDFDKLRKKYEEVLASFKQTSNPSPSQTAPSRSDPTVFNFMYNKNTLQQTELKVNSICPWCSLDCNHLYPLLKHMSLCHPRFLFTYSPVEGGANIDVRLNRLYDSIPPDHAEKDLLTRRKRPTKCQPCTSVLVKKKTTVNNDLNEFMAKRQFSKHKSSRLFYHTQSCLPMLPQEKDSDDEHIPKWLKTTSSKMVDEFIDVNQGEKQFMKMWNFFTMEYMSIADKQLPNLCLVFAQRHREELILKQMQYNFISHVIYMCDIGLVPPSTILEISKIFSSTPSPT